MTLPHPRAPMTRRSCSRLLRRRRALGALRGDHPFGSVLADGEGNLSWEAGKQASRAGEAATAPPMQRAPYSRRRGRRALTNLQVPWERDASLYTSAGAVRRCAPAGDLLGAGIGRGSRLRADREGAGREQTGAHEENPTLDLPCDIVFAAGQRPDRSRWADARGRGGQAAGGFLAGAGVGATALSAASLDAAKPKARCNSSSRPVHRNRT